MTTDVIPAVGAYRASTSMEPYRATRLWNDMIQTVYSGLALGRHRRYMKAYDQCFVASEAITWLHKQLQRNPNFGLAVTRNQTMQLFQKFHAAKIFEDVRGTKHNNEMFADNGRLFRYVDSSESPVNKPRSSVRNPLATRNTMMNTDSGHSGPVKCMPEKTVVRPMAASDGRLVSKSQPTPKEVEYVWKMITLKWLQRLLRRSSLDDILDTCHVHAPNIIHNMTQVNKNGIVTNIDQKDQLPHWVLSAMRCLAYWPEKVDDHLPDYPGFQKDVFKVIKDYFDSQAEPLLTFNMYETFANVVVYAEGIGQPRLPARSTVPSNGGLSHELMTSVENLIMNMTVDKRESTTAEVRPQDIIIVHDPSVATSGGRMFSYESVASMPGAKFETSFGVDSVEPHTHVYPLPGQWDSSSLYEYSRISHDQRDARSRSSSRLEPYSGDQKSVSLMDVNNVTPIPENTLSNYVFRDSLTSVTSSINAGTRGGKNESYGYSVVLSSVPDIRCHAAKDTTPPSEQGRKLQPDLANPVYQYHRSDLPPPYKPPPSYTSLHQSGVFLVSGERLLAPPKSCQRSQFTGGIARPTSAVKRSPTASFRQAIEGGQTETPPKTRRALLATLKRSTSSPSLLNSTASRNCVIESLQTCCLLLPPASRRKLHLLLRLMHKMVNNSRLQVEDGVSTRKLVLEQFSRCILRPHEEVDFDEGLTAHIVELMMDNYMDIMKVPDDLKDKIEDKLTWLRKSKVPSDDRPASEDTGGFDSDSCQKKMTFCERMTVSEYEHQKLSSSQGALQELLDGIVKNKEMTLKEKKKHLKHFRKSYPDIYCQRFPTTQSESSLFPDKPRIKPALLGRPLQKLRSLRL